LNGIALVSIAEENVAGEAEALAIAIAKDTDLVISANETASGAGANCDIILVCQVDDGE
jgi:predicted nucleic acid-binding protein